MKLPRALGPSLGFLALSASALAHPGHDGHELTWDLGTGLGHQLATLSLLALPLVAGVWFVLRRRAQSKLARVASEARENRRQDPADLK